jgi:CTP synthase
MVIETARNLAGITGADSAEFDPQTPDAVISTMADQVDIVGGKGDLGGTMRLGSYPAALAPGSVAAAAYGSTEITERHRHRYEVANAYRDRLTDAGLVISGTSPDGTLVEFVELPADVHPFYVGTQAHPELKSRPTRPHPLFAAFVKAAVDRQESGRIPVPENAEMGI